MTDLAFDLTIELRVLNGLTRGRLTPAGDYAADLLRAHAAELTAHAATRAALEHAHQEIERLRVIAGTTRVLEQLVTLNDYDDTAQAAQADEFNMLEAAYIATVGELDQYHAWREGTLPEHRQCEPDCGACQILADVPDHIINAATERNALTETGVQL